MGLIVQFDCPCGHTFRSYTGRGISVRRIYCPDCWTTGFLYYSNCRSYWITRLNSGFRTRPEFESQTGPYRLHISDWKFCEEHEIDVKCDCGSSMTLGNGSGLIPVPCPSCKRLFGPYSGRFVGLWD